MLSSRGTLTIDAVLNECIGRSGVSQSFGSSLSPLRQANSVIPLTEAQAVWTALGTFLRNQMLLGHPITIPKLCSFWCRQRHVATQGNVNFYVREVCFGFAQSFVTTYNLNPMVALEDPKIKFLKVPLDLIAQEARVPADVCANVLKEVALFIGEGTFNGKSFNLSFPTVLDVQLKKERTFVSPCSSLVTELLAIDTRKWPADMREVAAAVVLRPATASSAVSASSSRSRSRAGSVTGTAQSRPSTRGSSATGSRRTASSAAGRPHTSSTSTHDAVLIPPRPLFVTAVTQNKTFAEIEKAPTKEIRHVPRLPGAKGRELIKALRSGGVAGAPAVGGGGAHRHVDPLAPQALLAPSTPYHDSAIEEESVYDVLSPSRRVAAAINNAAMNHLQDGGRRNQTHFDRDDENNFDAGHNYGESELHDHVGYGGLHDNGKDGDYFGEGADYENSVAPPPALSSTAAPPSTTQAATRARFPLADRTSTANSTHNRVFGESTPNNAIVAGKKRITIQEHAVAAADQNERNAQRHDVRVPSCSHATRPPWHTDEENVVERHSHDVDAAAACERFGKRRNVPSNHFSMGYQQQVPQQHQERATSSGGGRRHFEHPAEKTHIKDLLYENTYFMK